MSTRWTTEQQKAIEERNNNILVSAAAGSGKTAVLVQRVVDMVTDKNNPVYINHLLVATFTNAAAMEMKERIFTSLQEKINENPNDKFIKEQLVLLGQAQISTVHSFCTNLIRENFHLLGIRPDFDIADEVRLSQIRKAALDEVLEMKYNDSDLDFNNTVDAFGGKKDDSKLAEIVLSVFKFAESLPNPELWLVDCYEHLKDNSFIEEAKKYIEDIIKTELSSMINEYDKALNIIENDAGLINYYNAFLNDYNMFVKMYEDKNDDIVEEARNFKFERLKSKKSDADPLSTLYVKTVRDDAKSNFEDIIDIYCYTDREIKDEIDMMYGFVKTVCTLVLEFKEKFASRKRKENILDFNDLEHYAIKVLEENDDLRDYMKNYYSEILVDEYQDTNGVQAHLFNLLSNGKNLFTVGDVKQSIYGFRNSNPRYFLDKYNLFTSTGSEHGVKINLSKNFRSSNFVLRTVNRFFEKLMIAEIGGVSYDEEHALIYGNEEIKDIDLPVERYIINTSKKDNEGIEEYDNHTIEAIFVANKIHNLVEVEKPQIYDKNEKTYRCVTYKDIVVLMRKTKDVSSLYADVFAQRGIPVYTEESGTYFNCTEVATIISFLKIIENPLQDIPFVAIMRSPIFSFDDNYIAKIRSENKKIKFYNLLKKSNDVKAVEFVKKIDELRKFSKFNDIGALVRKIVFDTGYYYFAGNLPNGNVRMKNLDLLCEKAVEFSAKGHKTVSDFISYVKSMIESNNEYSSPKLVGENENVVNIMSIHKSKGLEFPVVFLCETSAGFNTKDIENAYVYDEKFGLAMNIIDVKKRVRYKPYYKKIIGKKKKDELIAEEIRLLYVALTRAKYKLIITGALAYKGNKLDFDLNPYRIKMLKNYLDMLIVPNECIADPVVLFATNVLDSDESVVEHCKCNDVDTDYSEFFDEISSRLEYSYKYPENKFIPSKKSISEIIDGNDEVLLNRIVTDENKVSAAQKGTFIHFVLQNINLADVDSTYAIMVQIDAMIKKEYFDKEYKDLIDVDAVYNFFVSEIGKRMLESEKVYREFKFCVDVPANELGYNTKKETILIQGVIDCCFLENDEFVIIDYKTGKLNDKYKRQIQLYKKCLEISTGKKVKETHIYPLI